MARTMLKFGARAYDEIFLGYSTDGKDYQCYNKTLQKIVKMQM